MEININKSVAYNVAKVSIKFVVINKQGSAIYLSVPWQWVDASGKVLRSGSNQYKETDLQSVTDFAKIKTALVGLMSSTGTSPNLIIKLDDMSASSGSSQVVNGKATWVNAPITSATVTAALTAQGITLQAIQAFISGMTEGIFA